MIDFKNKLFGVISLGCDKNRVDSEKLLSIIKSKGCPVTDNLSDAEIVIVNTCAFLNEARKEAIETALEVAAYKSGKLEKLVVTGCLPQKYSDDVFKGLAEADVILGVNDYDKLFEALEKSYEGDRVNYVNRGEGGYCGERVLTTPLHYAYLKIADGCNNRCTYCLIPKIRGGYVSYPMENLVREAKSLGEISELILVAQDVTRYGVDIYGEKMLPRLLRELTAIDSVRSVRLLYCYPDLIDDALINEIKSNSKIIKYLDIPLQHSEDEVLKRMNRPLGRENYLALINKLRAEIPGIALRSTFITGFPGETEENFSGLCDFIKVARFDNCGFFAYSREPETPAYKMQNQVPYGIKRRRVKKLYEIQRAVSAEKLSALHGAEVKVLCDGVDYDRHCFIGRAYFSAPEIDGKVYFNARNAVQGEYYGVVVSDDNGYDLFGATEDYLNE